VSPLGWGEIRRTGFFKRLVILGRYFVPCEREPDAR
jgi:hypothetical protein